MSAQKTTETVASLNFPSYAIVGVCGRHILVGGGGGSAKTGIKNQFVSSPLGMESYSSMVPLLFTVKEPCVCVGGEYSVFINLL